VSAALASVLVLFLAPAPARSTASESDTFERGLASVPQLSIGILSATQGAYTPAQLVLDMTQGARVSPSAYPSASPPALTLEPSTPAEAGPSGRLHARRMRDGAPGAPGVGHVQPWSAVLRRAEGAPQLLEPGLLAQQIPGGSAYVPCGGTAGADGALAADSSGRIAEEWPPKVACASAIRQAQARHELVVADLPSGRSGQAELRTLAATRPPGQLLVVVQRAASPRLPDNSTARQQGRELLWVAFAGVAGGEAGKRLAASAASTITSQTTNEPGMVAAIDLAPTILRHLGIAVPADMRGEPVRLDGRFDGSFLRGLKARLGVISGRRLPALGWLLIAWALLLGATRLAHARAMGAGAQPDSSRASSPAATPLSGLGPPESWALRVGGLGLLWSPVAALATAALEPSRAAELALLVAICFGLGALTDRLVAWPRAPLAPAIAAVVTIAVDALAHTQLLMRSLLGPDPQFGARFYGIGNELKSGLAVLVLCAVAAALHPAVRGRRAALSMALAGIVLAAIEGSARIGAGVGAVILVSAGTAVASVMLLPGALNRRRALLVLAAPVVGLAALAVLDVATAHGGGHFTGSILHARSAGDLRDVIVRRYGAAWDELRNRLMPLASALALGAGVLIVRGRQRLCSPLGGDPAWAAALCGGFAAGLVGALSEDSGPVLLVVAVGALGCVLAYVWGKPSGRDTSARRLTDSTAAVSVSKS
jgi:hypothetical protein